MSEPPRGISAPAPDLSGMTKAQLLSYAAGQGMGGVGGQMKKAEIIEAIQAQWASR